MQRRKWDAKTKAMIVLEGLKGKPVAELCTEHQISQAQYYQGRDQFLAHASKAFEVHEQSQAQEHIKVARAQGPTDGDENARQDAEQKNRFQLVFPE